MKRIGVFASGGDAPGMNAAIRSVVRSARTKTVEVYGFIGGYNGLITGQHEVLELRSVANIIQRGGSILKAGRCLEFTKEEGRAKAKLHIERLGIEGLICIGGDGSLKGAHQLWLEHQIPYVAIPGTIDNDIYGTDYTIGFDTAINTAVEAIDKIRDTAASHDRLFIIEVMGRESGFIAVAAGLAGGAEDIFIPESPFKVEETVKLIQRGSQRGKLSSILVTAEGHKPGRAYDLADAIRKHSGHQAKVCVLGHIQRGGTPTALDRLLASRMASSAVDLLFQGYSDLLVGVEGKHLVRLSTTEILKHTKHVDQAWIDLARVLSN